MSGLQWVSGIAGHSLSSVCFREDVTSLLWFGFARAGFRRRFNAAAAAAPRKTRNAAFSSTLNILTARAFHAPSAGAAWQCRFAG
jgi:hypothetical protein